MTTLPHLGDRMFLSDQVSAWVEHAREAHADHFALANKVNEIAHRAFFAARCTGSDLRHVLLLALVRRAMTAYQAAIILWERGLPQEGQVALRTLLEVAFKANAIAKDSTVAILYAREDETLRRKLINKYRLLSSEVQDPGTMAKIDALQQGISESIQSMGIKELSTEWFARRAEMLDDYNSAYAVLSTEVHVSSRSLERALDLDDTGEVVAMRYGFSDRDIRANLVTCIETFINTLQAGYSMGDIPEGSVEEINMAHLELQELRLRELPA